MSDDEIIGLKSTSIKFKKNIKIFVFISYFLIFFNDFYLFKEDFGKNFFTFFFYLFLSLIYQINKFNKNNPKLV